MDVLQCTMAGGRGDTGRRDACVAARAFAAQAGATGRYCQDPVRAATWRGHQSVSTSGKHHVYFSYFFFLLFYFFTFLQKSRKS